MTKNKETSIDELAMMVQKGFQGVDEKIDKGFKQVNDRIDGIQEEMNGIKSGVKGVLGEVSETKKQISTMSIEIDNLQRGQERIEDRLDEIASEKKEHTKILNGHDERITILEKRTLLAK